MYGHSSSFSPTKLKDHHSIGKQASMLAPPLLSLSKVVDNVGKELAGSKPPDSKRRTLDAKSIQPPLE